MLSRKDHIRLFLKNAEFQLPGLVIQGCFKIGLVKDPFVEKDHDLKCIFIHVPKAAGSSLRKSVYHSKSFHIPVVRYKAVNPTKFENYFKFCFVRNPWDRLQSAYEYLKVRCHGDMSFPDHRWAASNLSVYRNFAEFVIHLDDENIRKRVKKYIHFRDQLDWICDNDRARNILVDFVGRYETIQDDYQRLGKILDLSSPLSAERENPNRKDYRQVYSTKMVDIVSQMYSEDIKRLGYSFE